jgi:hypothetical protein
VARAHTRLLRVMPVEFRQAHAAEMAADFRRLARCLAARRAAAVDPVRALRQE